jgi:CheY-like chemotaxis protein
MAVEDPLLLIVDDSDADGLMMRIVFERAGLVLPLRFAPNGLEAIAYLRGDGDYADRTRFPLPTVMLLDLNMPRKNGFEVLEWLRQQPSLKRLCVYVLSSSARTEDIARSYDLGANGYLVKPSTLDALTNLAQTLVAWIRINQFAPVTGAGVDQEIVAAARSGHQPGLR